MQTTLPWLSYYGSVPAHLDYAPGTLYQVVAATARQAPEAIAWEFFDTRATYRQLLESIDRCAALLDSLGLKAGDRFLISMPTMPQAVIAFYAANRLGAVPALIHPLSTSHEVTHYLNATGATVVLTLDAFYPTIAATNPEIPLTTILLARMGDYLSAWMRAGFWLSKGRKIRAIPPDVRVRYWAHELGAVRPPSQPHSQPQPISQPPAQPARRAPDDLAAILFSGGTTSLPKGILLTNRNFIAEGTQAAAWCGMTTADSMLAILPIFHGFGLAVCVNAVLMAGGKSILVPQFSAEVVAGLLRKKRPNILVGVPTLFDALTRDKSLAKADLSCLKVCFCGADTLPRAVKERFEKMVHAQGGSVRLLEGYGLTESVSGVMGMPLAHYREGSIGIPFPDMLAEICLVDSVEEAPVGAEGEICLSGPAVMLGYLGDTKGTAEEAADATAQALRRHADGRLWLHTGDLGHRDADGFFYFSVRLKRMIKSSGFNVYPAQVEATLREHPAVADACVIGIPDPAQIERVVACVVLKAGVAPAPARAADLIAHCHERLIKWSCPREIFFIDRLPVTKVGKIDYRTLVRQHTPHNEEATP